MRSQLYWLEQEGDGRQKLGECSGSGALTERQVRLSAPTSFACSRCGRCAGWKASVMGSSLFSAPGVARLRGDEPCLRPAAAGPTNPRTSLQLPRPSAAAVVTAREFKDFTREQHRPLDCRESVGEARKRNGPSASRLRRKPRQPSSGSEWDICGS